MQSRHVPRAAPSWARALDEDKVPSLSQFLGEIRYASSLILLCGNLEGIAKH